jgi:Putative transposase DNA-binding domain
MVTDRKLIVTIAAVATLTAAVSVHAESKGLEIREWTCDDCGAVHDRDVNAARNILRMGRQALAEGSSIQPL